MFSSRVHTCAEDQWTEELHSPRLPLDAQTHNHHPDAIARTSTEHLREPSAEESGSLKTLHNNPGVSPETPQTTDHESHATRDQIQLSLMPLTRQIMAKPTTSLSSASSTQTPGSHIKQTYFLYACISDCITVKLVILLLVM